MTRHLLAVLLTALLVASCGDVAGFSLGAEAKLTWTPSVVTFSDVPRGESATRLIVLQHIGTGGIIRLDPIELETDSADLRIELVENAEIGPGEECRIQIAYDSNDDAPDLGELRIRTNLAVEPEVLIPISTPGQRAQLVATPATVDFGIVQAGAPKHVEIIVTNIGTAPSTITGYEIGQGGEEFTATIEQGLVVDDEGGKGKFTLTYTPTGQNKDSGVVRILTDRPDVVLDIPVEGAEETPILVAEPATLNFSWVEPGSQELETIKFRNLGNTDLTIWEISLDDARPEVSLTKKPAVPLTLEPGEVVEMGAIFSPNEQIAMDGTPLARLVLSNTDAAHDPMVVPIYGAAGIPDIVIVPSETVDFAYVAEGFKGKRTVTILNVGDESVSVDSAAYEETSTDEFTLDTDDLPATLVPGESVTFDALFENTGGDEGTEFARLLIETTDKLIPVYPLDVVARRSERPTCEPAFVPELLSMGAHKPGSTSEAEIYVVNFGSGNCEYKAWDILGCTTVTWGIRTEFDCDPTFPWSPFDVTLSPPAGEILGPGESLFFRISFTAPPIVNDILGRDEYYGRIALTMHDPNLNAFKYVAPPGGWAGGVNLRAESALPLVGVDPPVIDFGTVRTGCQSSAEIIQVSNLGPMSATISGFETEGCEGDVTLTGVPDLPYELGGWKTLFVEANYVPPVGSAGTECSVHIVTDAVNLPVADVEMGGVSIDVEHQIDTFLQAPTPNVDVIFVVDDSGSMADDQILLMQELPKLVEKAATWGQSYHMGVTTTDTNLIAGKFKGTPPWVDETVDPAVFAGNLLVGTAGHWEEMGLEGGWMAVSGQNITYTDIQCANIPNACPQGLWCVEGLCQGPNAGFLREDADLVVIMISDEEDSSPQSVDWYVKHFAKLKDPQKGHGVKMHALVHDDNCFGAGWGTYGSRYIAAVEEFGGVVASLCASDFSAEFDAIGDSTFGLKDQFYPSLPPDPATIEVRIDGAECSSGWEWNASTASVVLDEDGACYPPHGAEISIEYDVFCNGEVTE